LELKHKVLDKTAPPSGKHGRYRPGDKLLAFMKGLQAISLSSVWRMPAHRRLGCGLGHSRPVPIVSPCRANRFRIPAEIESEVCKSALWHVRDEASPWPISRLARDQLSAAFSR